MSRVRREIQSSLKKFWMDTAGVLIAQFSFPEAFVGFQGHFPGKPILPGVCLIQAMLSLYEAHHRIPIRLVELKTAKFIAPVLPGDDIVMECQEVSKQGREIVIRASCKRGNEKIAVLGAVIQIVS